MDFAGLSIIDRVLIVDEEPAAAQELRHRLLRLRIQGVGIESDARRALEDARRERPDIVLMNSALTGAMDGIEAIDAFQRLLDIPVVLMTGRTDARSIERAKACSPRGWLQRPFREGDLALVVEVAMQRHVLERRRRQQELRYATALDSIGDGVIAADVEGRITYLNAVAEALTGWRSDEALGAGPGIVQVIDEHTREPLPSPMTHGLAGHGKPVLLVTRTGELIPIDGRTTALEGSDGIVFVFRDTRRHRLAESAARRASDQLRDGQRMQALGQLAAGVAHDFNNLLTVINGYSDELLGKGGWDPRTQRLLERIRRAGTRSAELTARLLSFSRGGGAAMAHSEPDVLIADISDMLRRLIGEDVRLVTRLNYRGARVAIEPVQFEQIVMNLAVNARDAMPRGGTLAIATSRASFSEPTVTHERLGPGEFVQLTVSDTGQGMDPSVRAHIFEPFFTTKPRGKGTGLGLATVYGIVRDAGGEVVVYSCPGSGTVFKVFLPVVEEQSAAIAPPQDAAEADSIETATVLLVEDDPDVREFASVVISECGFRVISVANGLAALTLARTVGAFDALITDVVMPAMTGTELAARLRPDMPGLPVLFLSGYPEDELKDGGEMFLQKPFTRHELTLALRRLLARRQAAL